MNLFTYGLFAIFSLLATLLSFFDESDVVFDFELAPVVRVVDGDTIVVLLDGVEQKVRYIGIDTPEPYRDSEPACFSFEASDKNKELVQGGVVRLESGREDKDRYGRLLRYVYVEEVFVNKVLVAEGYAVSMAIKPNLKHAKEFEELAQAAQENKLGLWSACY